MKVTKAARVPAIESADVTIVIDVQNRAPVTDGVGVIGPLVVMVPSQITLI